MSHQPRYVLLTVVAGECRVPEQKLASGVALPCLSVGANADWVIRGEGISDIHLLFSFDGQRLRAAAASETARVEVEGAMALGVEWRELELPFELRLGTARLAGQLVAGSSARASGLLPDFAAGQRRDPALASGASGRMKTQLLDLSSLRPPALEGQATLSVGGSPAPFEVVSGSTLMWSLGTPGRAPSQPAPGVAPDAPAKPVAEPAAALDRTMCDRGALRDYARRLAAGMPEPVSASASKPEPAERWAKLQRLARALPFSPRLLALPSRRRLLALPVLASLGVLPWLFGTPSAAQGSRAGAGPLSLVAAPSAEAPPAEAPPAEAPPAKDVAPPSAEVSEATLAPDAGAATSRAAPRASSRRLEHDAFRAAFGGNVTEAATLYEELARSRGEPVFEHAARLVRQDRVHKP